MLVLKCERIPRASERDHGGEGESFQRWSSYNEVIGRSSDTMDPHEDRKCGHRLIHGGR